MTLVLSGISARDVYLSRAPLLPVHSGDECAQILSDASPRIDQIECLLRRERYRAQLSDLAALARCPADKVSVEVLVDAPGSRRPNVPVNQRVWAGPLPACSLCQVVTSDLGDDLFVVSPAPHLLLRCVELPFAAAVLLGFELCGTYELRPTVSAGAVQRAAPLTTVSELRRMLGLVETMRGSHRVRGLLQARRVADAVVDGSASPRESAFAALCTTGRRQGGEGLDGLLLNHEVPLTEEASVYLPERKAIRYDFFWPDAGIACEYDSAFWHGDDDVHDRDGRRCLAARAMGHEVISLSPRLFSDEPMLDGIFSSLRAAMGIRTARPLSDRTLQRRRAFQSLCLGHHCWW